MSLAIVERDLKARYGLDAHPEYAPRYNIAPQDDLDVVAADAEQMDRFNWGLRPH